MFYSCSSALQFVISFTPYFSNGSCNTNWKAICPGLSISTLLQSQPKTRLQSLCKSCRRLWKLLRRMPSKAHAAVLESSMPGKGWDLDFPSGCRLYAFRVRFTRLQFHRQEKRHITKAKSWPRLTTKWRQFTSWRIARICSCVRNRSRILWRWSSKWFSCRRSRRQSFQWCPCAGRSCTRLWPRLTTKWRQLTSCTRRSCTRRSCTRSVIVANDNRWHKRFPEVCRRKQWLLACGRSDWGQLRISIPMTISRTKRCCKDVKVQRCWLCKHQNFEAFWSKESAMLNIPPGCCAALLVQTCALHVLRM